MQMPGRETILTMTVTTLESQIRRRTILKGKGGGTDNFHANARSRDRSDDDDYDFPPPFPLKMVRRRI